MSFSLVKRSLDLFDDNVMNDSEERSEVKCVLSTNKYGIKKERKRLQQKSVCNKIKTNLKDKKIKSAIEEYKRKQIPDQTENNIYILQKLMQRKTSANTVEKLLKHKNERLAKDKQMLEKKKEEFTVFTDEDFEKFEKEYKLTR